MICNKCGKELESKCLFCTECGTRVGLDEIPTQTNTAKFNETFEKTNAIIDKFGYKKISIYLSITALVFMVAIRLIGFIFASILITCLNGYLIYHNYRKSLKVDAKMMGFSVAVLILAILVSI